MSETAIDRDGMQLTVYIPRDLAEPTIEHRWEEQTIYDPGSFIEIPTTLELGVIDRPSGRRAIILRKTFLRSLSPQLDLTKEIAVRPHAAPTGRYGAAAGYGYPIRAHPQDETGDRLRVWIPRAETIRLGLEDLFIKEIPARIYGTTRPGERKERRWVEHEVLKVYHLGRHYDASKQAGNWVWLVPESLGYKPPGGDRAEIILHPEEIFRPAYNMGYKAWAAIFKAGKGEVTIELGLFDRYPGVAKQVSRTNGFAFRNISNRNYSLKDENEYPFYCELRASFITVYPREFIELTDSRLRGGYYLATLVGKGAHGILGITLRNIVRWILVKKLTDEEGRQTGKIARYLYSGKLKRNDYQTRWIVTSAAKRNAGRTSLTAGGGGQGKTPPPSIESPGTWENEELLLTEGLEINEMIDELKFTDFEFEKCIKYARMVNRQLYYYVYDNNWIESQVRASIETYMDNKYQFIWTHIPYLE